MPVCVELMMLSIMETGLPPISPKDTLPSIEFRVAVTPAVFNPSMIKALAPKLLRMVPLEK